MADVGALIPTQIGLATVVQVLPGHVDPALSQVVTEPVGGNDTAALPPEYFGPGTTLPGQAQSAASFVQTLILPSDSGPADMTNTPTTAMALPETLATGSSAAPAAWPDSGIAGSTTPTGDQTAAAQPSTIQTAPSAPLSTTAPPPSSPVFAQVANAYQTTQQRGGGSVPHALLTG